jgi:glycosyltransferase involved in cell wall biosynthesis
MLRGRYPSRVIVGHEHYGREYAELYGFPADRVVVIPHGVALEEFSFSPELRDETRQALGVGPDEPVLLTVAGRARQKGLDVVAESLRLMPADRPWRFVCAGDGSRSPALESRTAELRRAGRVSLLGRVPDVRALYCAADLLVFPSRYDPWGMVVTEALACGLPVACSGHIGAASAVRPGVNGALLKNPDDPVELRDAVLALLGRSFDRAAVAASVADLSWDACAERMEPYLEASARVASKL